MAASPSPRPGEISVLAVLCASLLLAIQNASFLMAVQNQGSSNVTLTTPQTPDLDSRPADVLGKYWRIPGKSNQRPRQETEMDNRIVVNVGGVFTEDDFNESYPAFQKELERATMRSNTIRYNAVGFPFLSGVPDNLIYICDAMQHPNLSVFSSFIIIGNQDMINTMSIVATYTRIPVLGYNRDNQSIAIRVSNTLARLKLNPCNLLLSWNSPNTYMLLP